MNSQLKERFQDKMTRLQKGKKKVFEGMFAYAYPKFISPIPPDYDSLPENYNKVHMYRGHGGRNVAKD